jgi:hypothetical protein
MENLVKAIPIPDRKFLDEFGNPKRWILKIVEPRELYGLIAFPRGFEARPGITYTVEIVKREKNYAVVRLHEHAWAEYSRYEDEYVVKIFMKCRCGAFNVVHIRKYDVPLVSNWRDRWYIRYATELKHQSEKAIKSAPSPRYFYIAVQHAEAAERLFVAMKNAALEEICKLHETVIYDDEANKYRVVEAWRGAKDKSWLCTAHPPSNYVTVFGWIDKNSFEMYRKAKEEAEKLWSLADEILGQQIDIGWHVSGRRVVSRLETFL